MKVSLCVIARNEAANIGDCIHSARGLADDVVVVDTGSRDETRDIARAHGARVFEFPWCDDFAAARNESIRHARGEWIFWLDADDRIQDADRAKLRELFGTLCDENVGYFMQVSCPSPDGGTGLEVGHVRLFRNDPRIRWEYPVHEQIAPSIIAAGGIMRPTDVGIVHTGYTNNCVVTGKLARNLRLLDIGLEKSPFDGVLLLSRAGTLIDLARASEAVVTLDLCEAVFGGGEAGRTIAALQVRAHAADGRLSDALAAVRRGLKHHPTDTALLFYEARILAALGDWVAAEVALRALLMIGEDHPSVYGSSDRTIMSFRARHALAETLLSEGRANDAAAEALRVTTDRPTFGPAWLTLGEALLAKGECLDALLARFEFDGEAPVTRATLSSLAKSHEGQHASALEIIERARTRDPDHFFLSRIEAEVRFRAGQRGTTLDDLVAQILRVDPLCARVRAIARLTGRTEAFASRGQTLRDLGPAVARDDTVS